jgi:hypothetical protein
VPGDRHRWWTAVTTRATQKGTTYDGNHFVLVAFVGSYIAEKKVQDLQQQLNAYRDLSSSLARDEVKVAEDRK